MAILKPLPRSPKSASGSNTTLSNHSSLCDVPRKPIIFWSLPTTKPGKPLSTRNSEISLSPVLAETIKKSLTSASLMKCLVPLSRHVPSGCSCALVLMACASLPAPVSVIAIDAVRSPRTQGLSQRSICSPWQANSASYTLPKARRIKISLVCPICSSHNMRSTVLNPPPPKVSLIFRAYKPSSCDFLKMAWAFSGAKTPVFSTSSSKG